MLTGYCVKPEKLGDIDSAYATVNDSVRVHYKTYGDGDTEYNPGGVTDPNIYIDWES